MDARTCASDPRCVAQKAMVSSRAYALDVYDYAIPADMQLAVKQTFPGATRAMLSPSAAGYVARGMATPRVTEGVAATLLAMDLDATAKHELAGRLIERGLPVPQAFMVLQDGLLSNDTAEVEDAARVVERVGAAIPANLRPVFAALLREQGHAAAAIR